MGILYILPVTGENSNMNLLFEEANGSLVICDRDTFVSGSRWKILQGPKHRLLQWFAVRVLCMSWVYEESISM